MLTQDQKGCKHRGSLYLARRIFQVCVLRQLTEFKFHSARPVSSLEEMNFEEPKAKCCASIVQWLVDFYMMSKYHISIQYFIIAAKFSCLKNLNN